MSGLPSGTGRAGRWALLMLACSALTATAWAAKAPNLKLKDLAGQSQELSALHGQIVVVNFWATWCGPCQEELPRLRALAKAWDGKSVEFVAVSIDSPKDEAKIAPLLQRLHVDPGGNFAVWEGSSQYAMQSFGLGGVVPDTVVIGPKGEIVTRIEGEARDADVRTAVEWLLNGRQGPAPASIVRRY